MDAAQPAPRGPGRTAAYMEAPPLTWITWPVMNSAPSDSRKATVPATSSGLADARPQDEIALVVDATPPGHFRVDQAGRDGVDGDAIRSDLACQALVSPTTPAFAAQ